MKRKNYRLPTKRTIKNIIAKTLLIVVIVNVFFNSNHLQSTRRITVSVANEDGLPIMHTFYERLSVGEDDLLEAWKEEWTKAGFEARVLTLEDAKRHPYFKEMEKVVKPMFQNGYDAMCFYRWLAMGASGGGWMSDYDTFPTNFPMNEAVDLPNGGGFTSFESHVPCLVSGSEEEWNRVSKLLVEAIPRVPYKLKSDMHSFVQLKDEKEHNIEFRSARENIREGFPYKSKLEYLHPREVDCKIMSKGRAIHMSHRYTHEAFKEGLLPLIQVKGYQDAVRKRGQCARIFLNDWRDQCGGSNVE